MQVQGKKCNRVDSVRRAGLARAGQAYQLCVLSNERCVSVRAFDVEGARGFDGGADVREEGEEKEEAVGWREGGCGEEHGPRARGTPQVVRFGSTPGVTRAQLGSKRSLSCPPRPTSTGATDRCSLHWLLERIYHFPKQAPIVSRPLSVLVGHSEHI